MNEISWTSSNFFQPILWAYKKKKKANGILWAYKKQWVYNSNNGIKKVSNDLLNNNEIIKIY